MSGKLSEKFAQMKKKTSGAPQRGNRVQQRQQQQANARASQRLVSRGIANSSTSTGAKKKAAAAAKKNLKKKGKKKSAPKKANATAEDLDKEMDTYWYKVGKGPNPDLASLDREMDDYFKNKPVAASESSAASEGVDASAAVTHEE